ncbi:hypothetical protein ACYF6T_44460, partial [Streptomyces sp. 7R007]
MASASAAAPPSAAGTVSTRPRAITHSCRSLSASQLGLDAAGLLPQPVDSTPTGEFVLFRQPGNGRHPRPRGERRPGRPRLP